MHGDCSVEATYDEDGVQKTSGHDAQGRELPDPVPTAPPVGYQASPTLSDTIKRMIYGELSLRAQAEGFETFEEAEDFAIEDDPMDPLTPYEEVFFGPAEAPGPVVPPAQGGAGGTSPPASEPPQPVSPAAAVAAPES